MSTSSGPWSAENGTVPVDKDNVFYERVRTYSPVTKMMQVLEPGSPLPQSPLERAASPHYQSFVWGTEPPLVQDPYQQGTVRTYIVQNPVQELQPPYQQGTIRRYIVQNTDQPPLSPFLKGVNFVPGNNVIYEKTIRRVEVQNPEQDKQIIKGVSSVSLNDVHEQNSLRKTSTQSSEQEFEQIAIQSKVTAQTSEQKQVEDFGVDKLDPKYFGELLAELSRKNNDLYSCLLQHVEKIGGRQRLDSTSNYETEIESLIPKGVSELTKQQIRYLLQMRQTSDKSMRLVLSTFSNLREELGHLQDDLNKLANDKQILERDLAFKESQVKEYETILASVRENNRQQQLQLKDSASKIRMLEETIHSLRNADADKNYRLKELEYSKHALEQESQNLRVQISETCTSPLLQTKTDEISKHYMEMINSLKEEKDREIRNLRSQVTRYQSDVSAREGSSSDLQMRLLELTSSLEERESLIKRQQEELFRLRQERESKGVTKAIITKKYRNQYPILGLLSDYQGTSPIKDSQTIVIERTGEMWKQEYFTSS
ncbi:protein POF1B [Rhinatrema bivittatum]|uniref:protein POF1B n=1 Tax=Rhinatrema bivittatum TaxID=194408 RepID=UPI0011268A0B|nr:protein POF1B [Rhinatrema bivittatum]